jgi:hypothetical protein
MPSLKRTTPAEQREAFGFIAWQLIARAVHPGKAKAEAGEGGSRKEPGVCFDQASPVCLAVPSLSI